MLAYSIPLSPIDSELDIDIWMQIIAYLATNEWSSPIIEQLIQIALKFMIAVTSRLRSETKFISAFLVWHYRIYRRQRLTAIVVCLLCLVTGQLIESSITIRQSYTWLRFILSAVAVRD